MCSAVFGVHCTVSHMVVGGHSSPGGLLLKKSPAGVVVELVLLPIRINLKKLNGRRAGGR